MTLLRRDLRNRLLSVHMRREEMARARKVILDSNAQTSQLIEAWAIVGEIHKFQSETALSEEAYLKAIDLIRTTKENHLLGEAYLALADALAFCRSYERSIGYYQKAIEMFRLLDESDKLVAALSQIAYACAELKQREAERQYLRAAIIHAPDLIRATLLERLALSLSVDGQNEEAVKIYEQALSIFEAEGFRREWQKRIQSLANIYDSMGDKESAARTLARG